MLDMLLAATFRSPSIVVRLVACRDALETLALMPLNAREGDGGSGGIMQGPLPLTFAAGRWAEDA